jgi:hypothetical protein
VGKKIKGEVWEIDFEGDSKKGYIDNLRLDRVKENIEKDGRDYKKVISDFVEDFIKNLEKSDRGKSGGRRFVSDVLNEELVNMIKKVLGSKATVFIPKANDVSAFQKYKDISISKKPDIYIHDKTNTKKIFIEIKTVCDNISRIGEAVSEAWCIKETDDKFYIISLHGGNSNDVYESFKTFCKNKKSPAAKYVTGYLTVCPLYKNGVKDIVNFLNEIKDEFKN